MIKLFQCERDFGVDQTEPYFIRINFQLGFRVFDGEGEKKTTKCKTKQQTVVHGHCR